MYYYRTTDVDQGYGNAMRDSLGCVQLCLNISYNEATEDW